MYKHAKSKKPDQPYGTTRHAVIHYWHSGERVVRRVVPIHTRNQAEKEFAILLNRYAEDPEGRLVLQWSDGEVVESWGDESLRERWFTQGALRRGEVPLPNPDEEPTLNELNAMAKLARELRTKGKFTKKSFIKANDLGLITFEGLTDRGDFVRSEVPDGLIERRRCRKTGELMSIYDAEAQGQAFDFTDAKYTVMCEPHGTVITVPDMKSAKILMSTPEDVCEFCYETVHGEEPNPKNALIAKAHRLWDAYYENPTKARLRSFGKHLDAMAKSRSASVKAELRRARRAFKKEIPIANPIAGMPLDIRAALDLLNLDVDSTPEEVRAEARAGMILYGRTGAAPRRPSIAKSTRGLSVVDMELRDLVEESEEVALDWMERGRPMDEIGDWKPWKRPETPYEAARSQLYRDLRITPDATEQGIRQAANRLRYLHMEKIRNRETESYDRIVRINLMEEMALGWIAAHGEGEPRIRSAVESVLDEQLRERYADPRSPLVRKTQKNLKILGYYKGQQTSRMTPETEKAVRAFQKDQGLPGDGAITPETELALVEERVRSR